MWVAAGPVVDVLAGEVVGVFAHVQGADQHGTRSFQARNQGGIARCRRKRAIDPGAGARGQPRDVEQVLDRKRNTGERQSRPCVHRRLVDRRGLGNGALAEHRGECVQHRIALTDPGQGCGDDIACLGAAFADGSRNLARLRPRGFHSAGLGGEDWCRLGLIRQREVHEGSGKPQRSGEVRLYRRSPRRLDHETKHMRRRRDEIAFL